MKKLPSRFVVALVAAFGLTVPGVLRQPTLAAQAGRIDGISPSCASVGAPVTISGIGFGAHNVRIAVDGVGAEVVDATGNRVTFIVPAGVHLGLTTVAATNPGGHVGRIPFQVCDLLVPKAWAGEWQMTITYRKFTTGSVTAVNEITAFIRSGEPFGLAVVSKLAGCTGSISDAALDVRCAAQISASTCAAGSEVQVAVARLGDTVSGSGAATITAAGDCGPLVSGAQTIEISGLRLTLDQNAAGPPPSCRPSSPTPRYSTSCSRRER